MVRSFQNQYLAVVIVVEKIIGKKLELAQGRVFISKPHFVVGFIVMCLVIYSAVSIRLPQILN